MQIIKRYVHLTTGYNCVWEIDGGKSSYMMIIFLILIRQEHMRTIKCIGLITSTITISNPIFFGNYHMEVTTLTMIFI